MESISLDVGSANSPVAVPSPNFPTVWLNDLRDVDLPEEGVISFRYSRARKTETETPSDETCSYELTLKAITDVCACGEGCSCEEKTEDERDNMDKLMEGLKEEEMIDESEDDNPAKY